MAPASGGIKMVALAATYDGGIVAIHRLDGEKLKELPLV